MNLVLYWVLEVWAVRAALTISAILRVFFFHIFMGKINTKTHETHLVGQSISIVFIVLGIYNFALHMHSRFAKIHRCWILALAHSVNSQTLCTFTMGQNVFWWVIPRLYMYNFGPFVCTCIFTRRMKVWKLN